ncbi:MAG TPA: hypothetical protein PLG73_08670 [Candidatus Sumerlaeota bacterium]|nr:hypothetical protein [Candidatus Sumerlaeota bacterium]
MARHDLSEEGFALLRPLLPPEWSGRKGKPYASHHKVLNGIFWILHAGDPGVPIALQNILHRAAPHAHTPGDLA